MDRLCWMVRSYRTRSGPRVSAGQVGKGHWWLGEGRRLEALGYPEALARTRAFERRLRACLSGWLGSGDTVARGEGGRGGDRGGGARGDDLQPGEGVLPGGRVHEASAGEV